MTGRVNRGRGVWVSAAVLALAGAGTFSACTWQEGDGTQPGTDAGSSAGGSSSGDGGGSHGGGSVGVAGGGGASGHGGASSGGTGNGGASSGGTAGSDGGASNGGASSGGTVGSDGGASNGGASSGGTGNGGLVGAGGGVDAGPDASADGGPDASESPCGPCPSGLCLPSGACAQCNPAGKDVCPSGHYCGPDDTCLPGCKPSGGGCASGSCAANHECNACVSDAECLGGNTCASGRCLPPCGNDDTCPGTYSCCDHRCIELSRDHLSCGTCGVHCGSSEFCGATGCLANAISNVCDVAIETFLLDGLPVDDPVSQTIRDGMVAPGTGCSPAPSTVLVSQDSATTINPVVGQPVVGSGNMQVVVGGPLWQTLIRYLEAQRITRVSFSYDTNAARFSGRSADGGPDPIIIEAPLSTVTESHDFFIVETVVDPASGTLTLALYGFGAKGTVVAGWYFTNVMLPARSTLTESYYIYEWTDQDGDQQPGAADTFTLVASGS